MYLLNHIQYLPLSPDPRSKEINAKELGSLGVDLVLSLEFTVFPSNAFATIPYIDEVPFYNVILEETYHLFFKSGMFGATWRALLGMALQSEHSDSGKLKRVTSAVTFLCQEDCWVLGWDGGKCIDQLDVVLRLRVLFS